MDKDIIAKARQFGAGNIYFEAGRKAGLNEVVDWLNVSRSNEWGAVVISFPAEEWDKKLKEWGL